MKKILLLALLLIGLLQSGFSQMTTTIIELDMCPSSNNPLSISANGTHRKWLYVRHKEAIQFRVKHVNPNSYSMVINGDFADILAESGGGPLDVVKELSTIPSGNSATGGSSGVSAGSTVEQAIQDIEARIIPDLETRLQQVSDLNRLFNRYLGQDCLADNLTERTFIDGVKAKLDGKTVGEFRKIVRRSLVGFKNDLAIVGSGNKFTELKAELDDYEAAFSRTSFDGINQKIETIEQGLQNTVAVSPVIQPAIFNNKDVVRFTVDKFKGSSTKTTTTYDVYIVGGFKIDISAGVFINGLVDEDWIGQEAPTSTSVASTTVPSPSKYKPLLETADKVSFAAGSLIHVYPRFNLFRGAINFGVSAGASIGNRVNYYGGLSILIGRQQRIALTYGVVWGKVKRLSNLYKTDEFYPVTGGQFATREIIDRKWFFGFTYNLGGKKSVEPSK